MSTHSLSADVTPTAYSGQWTWHLAILGTMIVAILAVFPSEVGNAVVVWTWYPAYSHCYLIIPISAWLIWNQRAQLARMVPSLEPRTLFILPLLTLVWLLGYIAAINEIRQFTLVAMIITAVLTMLGWRVFRVIAFPVIYLFFLVPFGQYFIPPLQQFTTWFTKIGLDLLSVPHFTEGTVFQLPNGTFEIADACAGLRFLTAAIALGVLYVHLTYTKWWKSAAFLAASVLVPILANGLRCVLTMSLAYWLNDFDAVAENHITAGFFFNLLFIFGMFAIGLYFRDDAVASERHVEARASMVSRPGLAAVAAAALAVIATGPAFAYWHENRGTPSNLAMLQFPHLQGGWTVLAPSTSWDPVYAAPDQALNQRILKAGDSPVDVKVFYYERLRKATSLIATTNRLWNDLYWHPAEFHNVQARLGQQAIDLDETVIFSPSEKRVIWSSYWIGGQFTTSGLAVKLLQFKSILSGNEGTALIAFSTPIEDSIDDARARLKSALLALQDLPEQLDAAGRPRQIPIAAD